MIDATAGLVKYSSIDEAAYKIVKLIMSTLSPLLSFYLCLQLIFSFCVLSYQWNWVLIKWTLLVLLAVPTQRCLVWFTEQHTENKFILHYLDDFLFWGTKNSLFCKNTLGTFKLGIVCLILLADMLLEVHVGPFADVSLTPPLESQNTTIGL